MTVFSKPLSVLYINRFAALVGEYGSMITISLIIANKGASALMSLWMIQSLGSSIVLPFVGRIIDSHDKKKIMMITDLLRGILILAIPFVINGWGLYIIILLLKMLGPFFTGSMQPLITSLTTKDNRHRVNSIISSISSAAYCIGPMLGGLLLIVNNNLPFIVQSAGYLLSALLLYLTKYPSIPISIETNHSKKLTSKIKEIKEDMKFSLNFIMKHKILVIILLANIIYLCGGTALDAYEVLYVTKVLGMTETTYSIAISYLGFAFVIAGILNVILAKKVGPKFLFIVGMALASVSNILFSTATSQNIIYISFILLAFGLTSFSTAFYSLNQTLIPIEFQGRIMSFQFIVPEVATVFTVLISGYLLKIIDIRIVIIILASISMLGFLISLLMLFEKKNKLTEIKD
ncbi:MFS transporter [Bacillus thuringiensis]|uniref:MFS transporter n=1 Tax=Bacillus thuringiensis TaxID=1428 RepID=UPI0020D27D9B|nr:MFS transporter [Bacillus thuringiensis]